MGSANLNFDLPQEQEEFHNAVNGSKWKSIVFKTIEVVGEFKNNYDSEVFDKIIFKIYEKISEEGLSL